MFKYDKTNCLVNLSNSILKRFNVPTYHESIKDVDELLAKHKKIILFLCDGMGKNVLFTNKDETKDLIAHRFKDICSTFPPTTVAATNALLSGKFPNETGWLSWSQPFNNYKICVNVFQGVNSQTGEEIPGFDMKKYAPYENIAQAINRVNGKEMAKLCLEYPIDKQGHVGIKECCERCHEFLRNKEEGFVYGYITEPDHSSHNFGIDSPEVKGLLSIINDEITDFAKAHPEYLVLAIADHGHINVKTKFLEDYPDFNDTLAGPMCFEGRAANFKVKDDKKDEFEKLFNKYFGEEFELYTTQEVIDNEFYGPNPMPVNTLSYFGDYIAVAIKDVILVDLHEHDFFKGHHAGGTVEEGVVSLICYNGETK